MKKMIAFFVFACAFTVANANINAKTAAFVQPFDQSYALSHDYLWYTDSELTDPAGSYCDIWSEMTRLRYLYPNYSFSHYNYGGLEEFEYGYSAPMYYAIIYSDLNK
jgi:hypothetical protein